MQDQQYEVLMAKYFIHNNEQEDEVRKRAALKVVETEYERVVELSSDATNKYAALEKFEHFRDKMGY